MSRKRLCLLQPDNVTLFVAAAESNNLPILEKENTTNSSDEPVVAIWINLNYTEFAKEIVIPEYTKLKNDFNSVFDISQQESTI